MKWEGSLPGRSKKQWCMQGVLPPESPMTQASQTCMLPLTHHNCRCDATRAQGGAMRPCNRKPRRGGGARTCVGRGSVGQPCVRVEQQERMARTSNQAACSGGVTICSGICSAGHSVP